MADYRGVGAVVESIKESRLPHAVSRIVSLILHLVDTA
jgi:hypothetical protein